MTVRRLHSDQPSSFAFTAENAAWAKVQIAKYPVGRQASAVIPLLWRAQEQDGWLSEPAMRTVADMLGMAYIRVYEIATFYTMFQLSPVGVKAHVQVCGTTPCMLRGSSDLIGVCKERIAAHPHELSPDGAFSWEEVECLGSCANAPMVQIGADTYEDLTADTMHDLLGAIAKGRPVTPGSQAGRVASCPERGPTSLLASKEAFEQRASTAVRPVQRMAFGEAPSVRRELERDRMRGTSDGGVGSGFVSSHVVVGDEAVGEMLRPLLLGAPRNKQADDLKLIWGIGPMLEKALNKLGIWHFDQIAGWNEKHIKWIDQSLEDFRGRAERDKWVEQAKKLATGWRPDNKAGDKLKG